MKTGQIIRNNATGEILTMLVSEADAAAGINIYENYWLIVILELFSGRAAFARRLTRFVKRC
jgi:hypothetical protein